MTQPTLTLFHFPGACSQVSLCALEQAGLDYSLDLVNLAENAQAETAFKTISPLGKVPTLVIDGDPLNENAAILTYIAALRSDSDLLPPEPDPRVHADIAGGFSFCGATLHPIVRGLANPLRLTSGDGAPVRERSTELANKAFGYAEGRLAAREWWLGEASIIDVYLNWAFSIARNSGYDVAGFPLLSGLHDRLMARPAFARMQAIEMQSRAKLGL